MLQEEIRILVAEDAVMVGEMIEGMPEDSGYTMVGEADNGRQAVGLTQSLCPDVVLMDVEMPDMDGIEATRRIQERCPTPVVVLIAHETPELIEQASAAGAGAYLVKPPDAREMERAIAIAIARFDDLMELRSLNAELQEEIARRVQAEEALKCRVEELIFLNRVGRVIASSLDIAQVLNTVMQEAIDVLSVEGTSVLLLDDQGQELIFQTVVGLQPENIEGLRMPLEEGVAGWVAREGRSALVPDARGDSRFYIGIDEAADFVTRSLLAAPLKVKEKVIGVIEAVNKTEGVFSPTDLRLLSSMAQSVAIAIENARLLGTVTDSFFS